MTAATQAHLEKMTAAQKEQRAIIEQINAMLAQLNQVVSQVAGNKKA